MVGIFSPARRLTTLCPCAMNARISPVCAPCNMVFKSAPAMKMDFFADAIITPRNEASRSITSRCSFNSSRVAASKMLAPDSGRSNVSRQMRSSPISRRIIGAVATAGINLTLERFPANSKRREVATPCRLESPPAGRTRPVASFRVSSQRDQATIASLKREC